MKARTLWIVGILLLSGLFFISIGNGTGYASEFPDRPVEVIICWTPGGPSDLAARLMTDELSKSLGVPVIMTNKGGGSGAVGVEYVAAAKPDGYTIMVAPTILFTIHPLLIPDLHYKLSDFIPLCKYCSSPNLILVRKDSPFKTLEELVSFAKKNPGKLKCGTVGVGTSAHFSLEMMKIQAGINVGHLPYKGGAECNTALLGGHVDFLSHSFPAVLGLMKSGDFRALASTYGRVVGFPEIPTMEELGYSKVTVAVSVGYLLPKGTPGPIVEKLASIFEKVIKSPTVRKNLENSGQMMDYQAGPAFGKYIVEEYKMIEDVAKKAKMIK